jgi:hypothetical protein
VFVFPSRNALANGTRLGLLLGLSCCSLLFRGSASQCATDLDCVGFGDRGGALACIDGVCGQNPSQPACVTGLTDSNGAAPGGTCVAYLENVARCEAGFTDSNGTGVGGLCVDSSLKAAACDEGYTDSNGQGAGGTCVSTVRTSGTGAACDAGYFDTNSVEDGGTCAGWLPSCWQIKGLNPTAPTGRYRLAPMPGQIEPMEASCDMATGGGGWTLDHEDTFEKDANGWAFDSNPMGPLSTEQCKGAGAALLGGTKGLPPMAPGAMGVSTDSGDGQRRAALCSVLLAGHGHHLQWEWTSHSCSVDRNVGS